MAKTAMVAVALTAMVSQSHAETDAERMDRVIGRETIALMVHGNPRFSSVTMRRSGSGTYYCGRVRCATQDGVHRRPHNGRELFGEQMLLVDLKLSLRPSRANRLRQVGPYLGNKSAKP